MANRKRKIVLRVPVTAEEQALIQQKMALLHTANFSAYARKMLIDGYIVNVDTSDIRAQTAEIQKIGVNVNQIARCHNPVLPTIALEFWGLPMAFADHSPTNPRKTLQARLTDFQTRYQRTKCYK